MHLLKDKKALIYRLRDPDKILTVIPTAKKFIHNGIELVAVPHRPDEVRVLRALGFEAPNPMLLYYDFPGRFVPFDAQTKTSDFSVMHNRCFILNSFGLGKTCTALWAYDYLRSVKQAKRAMVVAPLSTLDRTWADEVFQSFPQLSATVLHGTRSKRLKLLEQPHDIYIINTDGVEIVADAMKDRSDIDLIIIDEVALGRNAATKRWKALNTICNKQVVRRVWGMTGSPTPNAPTDAWAQARLVNPTNPDVPKYFTQARDAVMKQINQFKWAAKENSNDVVQRWLQPAIRFALDDCVDLPPQIHVNRDASFTDEQMAAYREMMSKLFTEYAGGQILAVNEAVKASKLVQIACGVAYSKEGELVNLPSKPRIDVVKEIIEESEGKVIVFVPFTGALESVADELRKEYTVEVVHGATPKDDRDRIFSLFQRTSDPRVLVANPGTMSHGLTLTAATTIIWYAPIYSNETYQQACARIRRPGQSKSTVIAHIAGCDLERRIYQRLKNKESVQGLLLESLRDEGAVK